METDLVIQTLNKVVHRASHGLILQTDQGSQYLSNAYEKRLNELGIRHFYSLKGYPYDNSAIESFHASLKKEELIQILRQPSVRFLATLKAGTIKIAFIAQLVTKPQTSLKNQLKKNRFYKNLSKNLTQIHTTQIQNFRIQIWRDWALFPLQEHYFMVYQTL